MKHYEFTFTYTAKKAENEVIADILAAELGEIGFESFMSSDYGLKAYIAVCNFDPARLDECLAGFPLSGVRFDFTHELVEERNWNEEWEKRYFAPIRIDRECLIRASFHPHEDGFRHTIIIDPKMAFGTGNHATTMLMLREILRLDMTGREVLDMGCGTAVLAILASIKGASRVVAIDIDEWAYNNALENCKLNEVTNVEVALGGAEQIARFGSFDFIFANINRNILLQDIRYYAPALKPRSTLFISGFYNNDLPLLEEECTSNKLIFSHSSEQDGWMAAAFNKIDKKA
ncbi:MAG: 50S ribosomal protein L11 methyltransferase [Tannerella sp.]|jgi:ribosomal protein L11 methyltransferase|nr:50S ribosomal protein L11 methyltransferase [Tannerella sp.]